MLVFLLSFQAAATSGWGYDLEGEYDSALHDPEVSMPEVTRRPKEPPFVSDVFGDHMVLASTDPWGGQKEGPPALVWGVASPNEKITITGLPSGAVSTVADATGKWTAQLAQKASLKAFNLNFTGSMKHSAQLNDVMFGDTWLCSGQSNMDMMVKECLAAEETLKNVPNYPEIRLKNQGARPPWTLSTAETVGNFAAVCYFTAVSIKKEVPALAKRPMGLVRSSVGGTAIEMWMTPEALVKAGIPADKAVRGERSCNGQPNSRNYDNLIAPLVPFVFKGMMWYQGESNCGCNAQMRPGFSYLTDYYARLLPEMITSWRQTFKTSFTSLVVQLAAYGFEREDPSSRSADPVSRLRYDQLAATKLPRTGVAVAVDLGDDGVFPVTPPGGHHGGIHPRNKSEVGRRMALRYASLEGLVPGVVADGPVPVSLSATATGARLTFSAATSAGMGMEGTEDCARHGKLPAGTSCCQSVFKARLIRQVGFPFELLLSNGSSVVARAEVNRGAVALSPLTTLGDAKITGVRYSWQSFPLCVLKNKYGLPSTPFIMNVSTPTALLV